MTYRRMTWAAGAVAAGLVLVALLALRRLPAGAQLPTHWNAAGVPGRFAATFRPLYLFLLNKWYFDQLYDFLFVRPAFAIGRFFWKKGDEGTIDRFGPDGIAKLVVVGNRITARVQSGYVYTYALVMLLGLAGVATWAMTR